MKLWLTALIIVLLLASGGLAVLSVWHIPTPIQQVEKVVPDDRLLR